MEKKEIYLVGGYLKDKEVIDTIEINHNIVYTNFAEVNSYTVEEALKLPFVGGIEEYYKDKYGTDKDFYMDLTDLEQAEVIEEYVKYDELATLKLFTDEIEAKEYLEDEQDSVKRDDVLYRLSKLIDKEYNYEDIICAFANDNDNKVFVNENTCITSHFNGKGNCKLIEAYEEDDDYIYDIYVNSDNIIIHIEV